jgi:hypothetical protein
MRSIIIVVLITISIIFSGCTSQQNTNFSRPTVITSQSTTLSPPPLSDIRKYRIWGDPIRDLKTDSNFNITGSSLINISGTTNFSAGTELNLQINQIDTSRSVLSTTVEIRSSNSGPNSYFYVYDMKGNPPGQYEVNIWDSVYSKFNLTRFNITSDVPYYKWIRMNPLKEAHPGENIAVSGTTDMPAGSEISINSRIIAHSCPIQPLPDKNGQRTLCGGSCGNAATHQTIPVVEGTRGINTWNSTVNTTDWCLSEDYLLFADAIDWTNVTGFNQPIRLSSN